MLGWCVPANHHPRVCKSSTVASSVFNPVLSPPPLQLRTEDTSDTVSDARLDLGLGKGGSGGACVWFVMYAVLTCEV